MRYNSRRKEKRNQKTSALKQNLVKARTKEIFRKEGRVLEALPNVCFRIKLDDGGEILGLLSGKLRFHRIKILPGDRVVVEMTPYDKERGRIVYRLK